MAIFNSYVTNYHLIMEIHHLIGSLPGDSPRGLWADRLGQQRHAGAGGAGNRGTRVPRFAAARGWCVGTAFSGRETGNGRLVAIWK